MPNNYKLWITLILLIGVLCLINNPSILHNEGMVSSDVNASIIKATQQVKESAEPITSEILDNLDDLSRKMKVNKYDVCNGFDDWNCLTGRKTYSTGRRYGNQTFGAYDDMANDLASYVSTTGVANEDDDEFIFDSNKLLPNEAMDEADDPWFTVNPQAVNIQNSHLIDPSIFHGINSIGTSHKNGSLDLRPEPPCPKMIVAPWNQSSIEPDFNIKPMF